MTSNSDGSDERVGDNPVRAAEYVRMSTDHQRYSTENQGEAIRAYAARRNFNIVRTYQDQGKSGLNLGDREGLRNLLADVVGGKADFSVVLVYDVSRWGRFQDADESAYYEYQCKRAGVRVEYCAEPFENDGSLGSDIQKMLKRKMAGEYSRELSVKVFAGQCRLIEKGFRQGGPAGFGLRRQLVDERGQKKALLQRLEHKSIQTDRVILIPGPENEVEVVNTIYQWFVENGETEAEIAARLNRNSVPTDLGRLWTRGTVHQILINEKYVGNNVWNRSSSKLKQKRIRNDRDMWIRADGVFEPIVGKLLFGAAQAIIRARSHRLSDAEMLDVLRKLLAQHGYLSGLVIDEVEGAPSSSAYRNRFGSLLRTYSLIGYRPPRNYGYVDENRRLRERFPELVAEAMQGLREVGASVRDEGGLISINDEVTAELLLSRCHEARTGARRWIIRMESRLHPDLRIVVRMQPGGRSALDYFLFPGFDIGQTDLRLAERNEASLDAYRFDTIQSLYELMRRVPLKEVA